MSTELSIDLLEKSLLGTMLKENYLIIDEGIQPSLFQSQIHRSIYLAMQHLARNNQPVDYITILTMVEPREVGGANYLASLQTFADSEKFEAYLGIVKTEWREKQKQTILHQATSRNWPIEKIQKELDDLQTDTLSVDTDVKNDIVKMAERPYLPIEEVRVVPTDLKELEKLIVGFRQGELTIIAGRPSMGKTDVMNYFALTSGLAGCLPIIFSLEMNKAMLLDRLIAACGRISRLKMRDPYQYFSEKQREQWIPVLTELSNVNLQIDDRAGLTVSQMRAQVRKLVKTNPDLKPIVFIDYLQIIYSNMARGSNQTSIIGQISWELKQMAKEFACPVVCLSQLNRGVESRQNKRPLMSDLRDSGNIEQDADVIILLYRDSYYGQTADEEHAPENKGAGATNPTREKLELNVAKNRNGPTGIVTVNYSKMTGQLKE
ncbi:DnaB-like helicase C-terminal domain-containing protein [Lysinibacillus sp. SGAir0095]|uniref:replicative DNA helicase n=1 Tax=Lysinibacillus sp. SGAir0095 TaxID=2070463 RepID=UPI0010CD6B27|nr:DnaB-like helicase C-terminal domain-containing protein [Lysinibacillus sp. SGAir0095]QCR31028.1 DNA helicase [Lysinibacillus sp. SGAir0095]